MSEDGIARFRDFTKSAPAPTFAIDGVEFQCMKGIPLRRIGELSKLSEGLGAADIEDKITMIFGGILEPASLALFKQCVETDAPAIIDIDLIKELVPWLLEQYGLRPTQASSGSGETSSESGANSTDGAQRAGSTSRRSKASEDSTLRSIGSRGARTRKAAQK